MPDLPEPSQPGRKLELPPEPTRPGPFLAAGHLTSPWTATWISPIVLGLLFLFATNGSPIVAATLTCVVLLILLVRTVVYVRSWFLYIEAHSRWVRKLSRLAKIDSLESDADLLERVRDIENAHDLLRQDHEELRERGRHVPGGLAELLAGQRSEPLDPATGLPPISYR